MTSSCSADATPKPSSVCACGALVGVCVAFNELVALPIAARMISGLVTEFEALIASEGIG